VDGFLEEVEQVEEEAGLSNNVSFSDLHSR
jgi:hypothetical protein